MVVTDLPGERDLMLDAIDDAFKQAVTQFTKDAATGSTQAFVASGLEKARKARRQMIALLDDKT